MIDKPEVTRGKFRLKRTGGPNGSIYFNMGPSRIIEYPNDKDINRHQERVTHNDTCRCKQYEYNDLVVMYEHIEQYPQFRCYCEFCINLLTIQCYGIKDSDAHHFIRFQLAGKLGFEKGIDITK